MECVGFEKEAYEMLTKRISKLKSRVSELYSTEESKIEKCWIENAELAHRLNISLRTLQTYRERGILSFSMIGRKIYYKVSDVNKLITNNCINRTKENR